MISRIYHGDCIDVMRSWPENFVDTIITDPPYGLDFMGKDWDGDVPGIHFWEEMLRVCKPGAMLLSFGGTRTWHHLATAIEHAGWEVRDCLMWLYGSGFPKSHNLHGEFEGWGTALKPAWEPIIVAMKPLEGTFAENAEKWGVAEINVDGGRVEVSDGVPKFDRHGPAKNVYSDGFGQSKRTGETEHRGRWPANLILDEEAGAMLDRQSGILHTHPGKGEYVDISNRVAYGKFSKVSVDVKSSSGGASRFFYCAKASKSERNRGCEGLDEKISREWRTGNIQKDGHRTPDKISANHHPTVKPLALMEYLCTLTKTPTSGIVLDPFAGSGSTLIAAERTGRPWIGIEMNAEYVEIARARIASERVQTKMAI